jgi:hypothetical protein
MVIYVNDLNVENFSCVKHADDTWFDTTVFKNSDTLIVPAVQRTSEWAMENGMFLNTEKTVVMNSHLNYAHVHDKPVIMGNSAVTLSQHL